MSIPPPPYLLEYRAALAVMSQGNIGPATLQDMLDKGDAFFFDGDKSDFEKCSLCNSFVQSHKDCFLKVKGGDLPLQAAVAAKLIDKSELLPARRILAEPTLKMIGVAAREELTCVVQPQNVLWDNLSAYKHASVTVVSIADFVSAL